MLFPTHRAFMIHDSVRASLEAAFQDNWASIISSTQRNDQNLGEIMRTKFFHIPLKMMISLQ